MLVSLLYSKVNQLYIYIYPLFCRVTDVENKHGYYQGGKEGWINCEIGVDIYTLPYIKQITNKDLLYSTGNSTQYSVMYRICCIAETNTTL